MPDSGIIHRKGSGLLKGKRKFLLITLTLLMVFVLANCAGASQVYTVQSGDSLWSIAKRFGVTLNSLTSANQISANDVLPIGKELVIPSKSADGSEVAADSARGQTNTNNVILRSGPGKSNTRLGVIPRGTGLKILESSNNWSKVALDDGRNGWIYSPLIRQVQGSPGGATSSDGDTAEASNEDLIKTALANRGARYRYGGTSRSGFDCSGFTRYIYAKYGVALPHSSRAQYSHGKPVSRNELEKGDLVFFRTTRQGISHVGIYIGDGKFVHASNRSRGVVVDSLGSAYYSTRYVGARRVK